MATSSIPRSPTIYSYRCAVSTVLPPLFPAYRRLPYAHMLLYMPAARRGYRYLISALRCALLLRLYLPHACCAYYFRAFAPSLGLYREQRYVVPFGTSGSGDSRMLTGPAALTPHICWRHCGRVLLSSLALSHYSSDGTTHRRDGTHLCTGVHWRDHHVDVYQSSNGGRAYFTAQTDDAFDGLTPRALPRQPRTLTLTRAATDILYAQRCGAPASKALWPSACVPSLPLLNSPQPSMNLFRFGQTLGRYSTYISLCAPGLPACGQPGFFSEDKPCWFGVCYKTACYPTSPTLPHLYFHSCHWTLPSMV